MSALTDDTERHLRDWAERFQAPPVEPKRERDPNTEPPKPRPQPRLKPPKREPRIAITMRVPMSKLREIDRYAQELAVNRTEYLIRSATKTLEHHNSDLQGRVEALERDVKRLRELAYGE